MQDIRRVLVIFAAMGLTLGCAQHEGPEPEPLSSGGTTYQFVADPKNFLPPLPDGVRSWRFDASPVFDAAFDGETRIHVNEALSRVGLPPVVGDLEKGGIWGESESAWTVFLASGYENGRLQVRLHSKTKAPNQCRVVFLILEKSE